MSSGVSGKASNNAATGNTLQNQYSANAANVYGGLEPQLAAEAAHPTGLTPMQKASQNTAAQQSAGGGNAGAIGAGRLYAARTRNAGGAKAAVGQATRGTGQNLSEAALGTEQQDAALQQKNRQAGLSGLEGLNSEQTSAGEGALGLSNQALGVENQADANNPWMKILQSSIGAGGQVAGDYLGRPQ